VDLETEVILSATVQEGTAPDSQTLLSAVVDAQINPVLTGNDADIMEVAADKGYHSNTQITDCTAAGLRTYIPEPNLQHNRRWPDKPEDVAKTVLNNLDRSRRAKSKQMQRHRSERVERRCCPRVRQRRCSPHVASETGENQQALLDGSCGPQPRPSDESPARQRQTPPPGVADTAPVSSPHHHSKPHPANTEPNQNPETHFFNAAVSRLRVATCGASETENGLMNWVKKF
tara:strand:+ start:940 stop:1632 length:693 start_codon:yes stop_codon:yes gene_type:complete